MELHISLQTMRLLVLICSCGVNFREFKNSLTFMVGVVLRDFIYSNKKKRIYFKDSNYSNWMGIYKCHGQPDYCNKLLEK